MARRAERSCVPSLQSLALGVVARHVSELAAALGPDGCGWLPAEAKASLLAAARRRRELSDSVLLALADPAHTSLDVSGSRVGGAALLRAAERMPLLRALDVTGCERVSAGCLRKLPAAAPRLALLRLGGGGAAGEAAAKALPKVVPAIAPEVAGEEEGFAGGRGQPGVSHANRAAQPLAALAIAPTSTAGHFESRAGAAVVAAADSWEDLAGSGDDGGSGSGDGGGASLVGGTPSSTAAVPPSLVASSSGNGRLWELRVVVWPDCPRQTREALQLLCPRVVLNPPTLRPGALLGDLPRELDPGIPLDTAAFDVVGPAALEVRSLLTDRCNGGNCNLGCRSTPFGGGQHSRFCSAVLAWCVQCKSSVVQRFGMMLCIMRLTARGPQPTEC
jgi:hypothetical protein